MAQDDVLLRLARQIDAAKKTERFLVDPDEVVSLRRQGAIELHRICAEFAAAVNSKLSEAALDLSPATYAAEMFREGGTNLIQISSQGRQMQIAFEATPELVSTVKFLVPYVLEGEVRTYNQRMLERFEVNSRLIFFCVENGIAGWRYFDWRNRHTGPVDSRLLGSLMEALF
jgi:hypothetical protein